MPSYHIAMGQGLVLHHLIGNVIYTGPPPPGNALQSCSAVILLNPTQGRGGMYHYPAGPFSNNAHAKGIIANMAAAVTPTEAWLYYGNLPGEGNTGAYELSTHLLGIATHVSNRKATSGAVSVSLTQGGATQIATGHMVCNVDLTNVQPGLQPYGNLYA